MLIPDSAAHTSAGSRRTRPAWGSEERPRPRQGVGVAMSPTADIACPTVAPRKQPRPPGHPARTLRGAGGTPRGPMAGGASRRPSRQRRPHLGRVAAHTPGVGGQRTPTPPAGRGRRDVADGRHRSTSRRASKTTRPPGHPARTLRGAGGTPRGPMAGGASRRPSRQRRPHLGRGRGAHARRGGPKDAHAPGRAWASRCRQRSTSLNQPSRLENHPETRAPGPHLAGCRWHPARADGRWRKPQPIPTAPPAPQPGRGAHARRGCPKDAHAPGRAWASRCCQRSTSLVHRLRPERPPQPRHPARTLRGAGGTPRGPMAEGASHRPSPRPPPKPRPGRGAHARRGGPKDAHAPGRAWASRCRRRSTSLNQPLGPETTPPTLAPGPQKAGCRWHPAQADGRSESAGHPSCAAWPEGRSRRSTSHPRGGARNIIRTSPAPAPLPPLGTGPAAPPRCASPPQRALHERSGIPHSAPTQYRRNTDVIPKALFPR
jgi:hypothetical protein